MTQVCSKGKERKQITNIFSLLLKLRKQFDQEEGSKEVSLDEEAQEEEEKGGIGSGWQQQ